MKIENVEYSLVPFGASCGDMALVISFIDTEDKTTDVETAAKDLITQFSEIVKTDKTLEEQFNNALLAKTQLFASGECIAKNENVAISRLFFEIISRMSLEKQNENRMHVSKIRPPFLGFIGKPTIYSGANTFYENFNYLTIVCGLDGINDSNILDYYREFAMIEISRHNFCCYNFKVGSKEDLDNFEKYYKNKNVIDIDPRRVYLVPKTTDKEVIDLVASYCLTHGYRFGLDYSLYSDKSKSI